MNLKNKFHSILGFFLMLPVLGFSMSIEKTKSLGADTRAYIQDGQAKKDVLQVGDYIALVLGILAIAGGIVSVIIGIKKMKDFKEDQQGGEGSKDKQAFTFVGSGVASIIIGGLIISYLVD